MYILFEKYIVENILKLYPGCAMIWWGKDKTKRNNLMEHEQNWRPGGGEMGQNEIGEISGAAATEPKTIHCTATGPPEYIDTIMFS